MGRQMTPPPNAQQLCNEIYNSVSGDLSDAWISDDAGQVTADEYLELVQGSLWALEDARKKMKQFLRKHRRKVRG